LGYQHDGRMQLVMADATIDDEASPSPTKTGGLTMGLLATVSMAWMGGMIWLARDALNDPAALPAIAAGVLGGPIAAGLVALLLLRTSRAEGRRFVDAAAAMRAEAALLDRTVARLSATLAADRGTLTEQVAQLQAAGDVAEDRFAALARSVGEQAGVADSHARSLGQVLEDGQAKLAALVTALPRAQDDVRQAAAMLETVAAITGERTTALASEVGRLAVNAREAEALADGAGRALSLHADEVDQASRAAAARLEAAAAAASGTVEAAQRRLVQQSDETVAMLDRNEAAIAQRGRANADALADRLTEVEGMAERLNDRLEVQRASNDLIIDELRRGVADVDQRLETLHGRGSERAQLLAASISALGGSADAMTEALRTGDEMATRTIGTTESLLIALDSAAREIDETLPQALQRLDVRVAASRQVVADAKPELLGLVGAAESTHDAIEAIAGVVADQRRLLETLSGTLLETLSTGRARADTLGQVVDEAAERTRAFADDAAPRMAAALGAIRDAADDAAARAHAALASVVPEAVAALEAASGEAMRRAAAESVERQVRSLAAAAKVAEDAATRAGARVAGEVKALIAQADAVDAKVTAARDERADAERQLSSQRASQLIEAMHSASVDLTRALSTEVADTAWAAYLKGDRGVFTRRAVRLLGDGEAGRVAELCEADSQFRETTNRYVHDFEAMLRDVLARPEGTPIGITLLSSDMGKLYVALAQGIERLR